MIDYDSIYNYIYIYTYPPGPKKIAFESMILIDFPPKGFEPNMEPKFDEGVVHMIVLFEGRWMKVIWKASILIFPLCIRPRKQNQESKIF